MSCYFSIKAKKEKLGNALRPWNFFCVDWRNECDQTGNCGFGHIYWKTPEWKTSFFVQCDISLQNIYITGNFEIRPLTRSIKQRKRRRTSLNKTKWGQIGNRQRHNMIKSKEMSFEVTRANVSILNCVSITNISTEHYMEGVIR